LTDVWSGTVPLGPREKGSVGIKLGLIGRSSIDLDTANYDTDMGFSIGPFWDVPLSQRFTLGLSMDFHNILVNDQQQFALDFSIPFKYIIRYSHLKLTLKPAFAVGLGHLADITFLEPTNYLSLKWFVEAHWLLPRKRSWIAELGVLWWPVGGNSANDVTLGPVLIARVGYVL
jgi:hypothetical protein